MPVVDWVQLANVMSQASLSFKNSSVLYDEYIIT